MGLDGHGRIAIGSPADLVILEGRSWSEALSRPESRRTVLRAGRAIDTTPPAYAELDPLFA
jgi:cytosine deaminase